MTLRHVFCASLSLALVASAASASTQVIRDSIGADTSLTNGMPGVIAQQDGGTWSTPGFVINAPEDGKLTEARLVIFARTPANTPENNLANIYGYPMEFHVWTDGIEGGADSFDENPTGLAVTGHIDIDVNTPTASFITVEPFGITGPVSDPDMFTTFLVTIDLASFNVAVDAGTQYVMSIFEDNESNFITGGGFFRVSASRATGFEDVFRASITTSIRPGYVNSQHGFGYEQLAGSFTLGNADFDGDDDVDGLDFLEWQRNYGQPVSAAQDSNGDGLADDKDLANWEQQYGQSWPPPLAVSQSVPEPCCLSLALAMLTLALRRLRKSVLSPLCAFAP